MRNCFAFRGTNLDDIRVVLGDPRRVVAVLRRRAAAAPTAAAAADAPHRNVECELTPRTRARARRVGRDGDQRAHDRERRAAANGVV